MPEGPGVGYDARRSVHCACGWGIVALSLGAANAAMADHAARASANQDHVMDMREYHGRRLRTTAVFTSR